MMNSKLARTILISCAIAFFVMWVLEFRRAGLFDSYWLLLVSVICLLFFQFNRLKASMIAKQEQIENPVVKKQAPIKKTKK